MDIIQQLKDNCRPFGLMSEEMQEKAKKIGIKQFSEYMLIGEWQHYDDTCWLLGTTYRLRPDYEEQPEIVECEIVKQGDHRHYRSGGTQYSLHEACDRAAFSGFKFEDGSIHFTSIWHDGPRDSTALDVESGQVKVLHATHVLFRRTKP